MSLIQEAIADAKLVKEAAMKNAKMMLEESFEPAIKRILSQQLSEEEDEYIEESDYMDDGEEGVPAELGESEEMMDDEDDMELESILRELEDEEEPVEPAPVAPAAPAAPAPVAPAAPAAPTEDPLAADYGSTEDDVDVSDEELDEILREIEEEEMEDEMEENFSYSRPRTSVNERKLRNENAKLSKQLKEATNAISYLRQQMNEVSLLNHKLAYSVKLNKRFNLTEAQQEKVLRAFDNSSTLREAKLVYSTLHEHFSEVSKKSNTLKESASKTIKNTTSAGIVPNRWQLLAGIK